MLTLCEATKCAAVRRWRTMSQMPQTRIPRIIYQTTHMPLYIVPDLLGEHARGFERHIFNDSQARSFLHDHIGENASMAYDVLPGAHKADLWRYAILYVRGGIYLDIKTISAAPLADIFPEHNELPTLYTVRSARGWVHNGIIAAPPKHSIMKGLLDHMPSTLYSGCGDKLLLLALHAHTESFLWKGGRSCSCGLVWLWPWWRLCARQRAARLVR